MNFLIPAASVTVSAARLLGQRGEGALEVGERCSVAQVDLVACVHPPSSLHSAPWSSVGGSSS